MADREKIQIDLIKLTDGGRLLRLTDPGSGMSLERRIDGTQSVRDQKERLLGVFEAALARAEAVPTDPLSTWLATGRKIQPPRLPRFRLQNGNVPIALQRREFLGEE
jgi:hypothetical protein